MQQELNRYLVEAHQQDLRREAATERLAREARAGRTEAQQPVAASTRRSRRMLPAIRLAGVRIF